MIVFLQVVLFLLIAFISYIIAERVVNRKVIDRVRKYFLIKNEEYYNELLRYYERNKKIKVREKFSFIHRINLLIDRSGVKRSILVNPITLIFVCLCCFCICYLFVFRIFKIILLSVIIATPSFTFPIVFLKIKASFNEQKIERVMLDFLLQLKNYTRINNDIVYAMKEVKTIEPLQSYVRKFLVELGSGVRFEKAILNLREKINCENFKTLLVNIELCYLQGGSFSELIDKSYLFISDLQKEKVNRRQETQGARIVLLVLVFLDLFIYFSFINRDYENYIIMQKSLAGNLILYWNFISMWLLVWLSTKVGKLDY